MKVNHTTKQWKIDTSEDYHLNEAADWLKEESSSPSRQKRFMGLAQTRGTIKR